MSNEYQHCSVCQGELEERRITYTQELDGNFYIVTDVPAQVCSQCAEQYLSPETVDALQDLIERGEVQRTIHVPVFEFPRAIPGRTLAN